MAAIAHSPSFAKKVGVSQTVGKDFNAADKGKTFKKGGMMKKRRFDGEDGSYVDASGEEDTGEQEYSAHQVDPNSRSAHGLYDEAPAPKAAPKAPVKSASRSISDKSDMGPQDDTSGVSGSSNPRRMGFRRDMPSAARKDENAKNLAKELATTAVMGGAGKLAQNVYRVGKAANAARNLGLAKGNAAASGEGAAWGEFAQQGAPNSQKVLDKIGKANERKFLKRREAERREAENGMKKGGAIMKSLFKGKESYGEEMKEAKAIKSGKITPKQYAMGEKSEEKMKKGGMPMKDGKPSFMKKYAKGGGIEARGKTKGTVIRMASGGSVSSASRRADGIAQRGKTRC